MVADAACLAARAQSKAAGAVTGAMAMGLHASSPAPHGGIWVIGLIGKPLVWLVAIACGTVVSAACVVVAKHLGHAVRSGPEPMTVEPRQVPAVG